MVSAIRLHGTSGEHARRIDEATPVKPSRKSRPKGDQMIVATVETRIKLSDALAMLLE